MFLGSFSLIPSDMVVFEEFCDRPSEAVVFLILSYLVSYKIVEFKAKRQEAFAGTCAEG